MHVENTVATIVTNFTRWAVEPVLFHDPGSGPRSPATTNAIANAVYCWSAKPRFLPSRRTRGQEGTSVDVEVEVVAARGVRDRVRESVVYVQLPCAKRAFCWPCSFLSLGLELQLELELVRDCTAASCDGCDGVMVS